MDDFDATDDTEPYVSLPARRRDAIRPVTIRQLKTRTEVKEVLTRTARCEYRYLLDGDEFSLATFVGNIVGVNVSGESTQTLRIEDGTGKMTSTRAINGDQETEDPQAWGEHAYVRVFGVPRKFRESTIFEIWSIRPVKDYHEVFFHLMEAMVVTLQHTRGAAPKLYDSQFARVTSTPLPPSQSQPLPAPSTSRIVDNPREESQGSSTTIPSRLTGEDTNDDGDGSTEYYTDQPPDSPIERSPSPTPVGPFAANHSYEGHSDREEGPSSQAMQRPKARSSDKEAEDRQTPKKKYKSRGRDDNVSDPPEKELDDELDSLRSEFTSEVATSTPLRLKPDPYSDWSPAKRRIMVFIRSRNPGEEVNVKRGVGEGMSKIEMRNAIRELVKEGEIETDDGMNYKLTDTGPKYPRF